eukprot:768547-Hanusia_phi.AAC.4
MDRERRKKGWEGDREEQGGRKGGEAVGCGERGGDVSRRCVEEGKGEERRRGRAGQGRREGKQATYETMMPSCRSKRNWRRRPTWKKKEVGKGRREGRQDRGRRKGEDEGGRKGEERIEVTEQPLHSHALSTVKSRRRELNNNETSDPRESLDGGKGEEVKEEEEEGGVRSRGRVVPTIRRIFNLQPPGRRAPATTPE